MVRHWVAAAMAITALCGCGNRPAAAPDTTGSSDPDTAGKLLAYAPVPVAYSGSGEMWDRELLADSLFADFAVSADAETTATGKWRAFPTDVAVGSIAKTEIENEPGCYTLDFLSAGAAMYMTQTTVPLDLSMPNTWLVGTIEARCAAPNEIGISIAFEENGVPVTVGAAHPGDDAWHEVRCVVPMREPHPGARVTASVVKRNESPAPAQVKRASLRVTREKPEATPELQLIANGGFEDYAFTGSLYPWISWRWNTDTGEVALTAQGKGHSAQFSPLDGTGGVALSQRVHGLTDAHRGKTVTLTVTGSATSRYELVARIRSLKDGNEWADCTKLEVHPGNGLETFSVSVRLPEDRLPDEMYVDLYRKRVSQDKVTVDDVTLTVQ